MSTFWKDQPVQRGGGSFEHRALEASENAIALPEGFEWSTCESHELRNLFKNHYLADPHSFLDYTTELLEWLRDPDPFWNAALRKRVKGKMKLVGFIAATPSRTTVHGKTHDTVQINLMCLNASIREKGFAPLLIREITRRAVSRGVHRAVYTASAKLDGSVTQAMYWHRMINIPKLIDAGFYETDATNHRYYRVNASSHMHLMEEGDVPRVVAILNAWHARFELAPEVDETYVRRLLPRKNLVYSFIEDDKFACMYRLPYVSRVNSANAINQWYVLHAAGEGTIRDCVILAKNLGCDVLTCIETVFASEDDPHVNKFDRGSGSVFYYLYNTEFKQMKTSDVCMAIP